MRMTVLQPGNMSSENLKMPKSTWHDPQRYVKNIGHCGENNLAAT